MMELSFHICNFVFALLDREVSEARFWQKLMSKLQPKIAFFSKNQCVCLLE